MKIEYMNILYIFMINKFQYREVYFVDNKFMEKYKYDEIKTEK